MTVLCPCYAHQLPVAFWTAVFSLQRACPEEQAISSPADKAGEGIVGRPEAAWPRRKDTGA